MDRSTPYFLDTEVKRVAAQMKEVSTRYEQLFTQLAAGIYKDIEGLNGASEIMAVTIDHIDRAILAFQRHFPDDTVIACAKGCHHCCYFPIHCPPQGIADIARHVSESFPSDRQRVLLEKLAADAAHRKAPLWRARCPFLDEAGACLIYERRPLACRWFTSPDASLCEKSVTDGRNIQQHPILQRIYQAATTVLLAAEKKQGRFNEQLPFVSSLLEALRAERPSPPGQP